MENHEQDSGSLSPSEIAAQFVLTYFRHLHKEPETIHQFYSDDSLFARIDASEPLSDANTIVGQQNIQQKVQGYNNCKVAIATIDAQATLDNSILVLVSGIMLRQGEAPQDFVQTFVLQKDPVQRRYYVANDLLRFRETLNEEPTIESYQGQPEALISEAAPVVQEVNASEEQAAGVGAPDSIEEPDDQADDVDGDVDAQAEEDVQQFNEEPAQPAPEPVPTKIEIVQTAPAKPAPVQQAAAPEAPQTAQATEPPAKPVPSEPARPSSWAHLFKNSKSDIAFLPQPTPQTNPAPLTSSAPARAPEGKRLRPTKAAKPDAAKPEAAPKAPETQQASGKAQNTQQTPGLPSRPRPPKTVTKVKADVAPNKEGEFLVVKRKARPQKEKSEKPKQKPAAGEKSKPAQTQSKNLLAGAK